MTPLLHVEGVSKSFPGVRALDQVSLHVAAGEALAVVGENGAGKSTLMRILAGVETPDAGEIRLDGQRIQLRSVRDALERGIVLIHQELNLAENLSVAANLFLGRELTWGGRLGWLNRRAMDSQSVALLRRVGLAAPPNALVAGLPIGQRQLVEIARALAQSARIIIMDEPTSSLSHHEAETLFGVIRELQRNGVAVVYISHRLGEVKAVADRVVVLRDGRNAGELAKSQIQNDAIVRLMIGRELRQNESRLTGASILKSGLEVRGLRVEPDSSPISFRVGAGEIVGMAGLVGAGRTELAEAIVGLRPLLAGEVSVDGKRARIRSPRDAMRLGVLLAPEDRRQHGLILRDGVQANLALPNLDRLSSFGLVRPSAEARLAHRMVDRLRIKTPRLRQPVGFLSGGNQQKVVFGKWIARQPRVLILDEPTRGVDVGARGEIYDHIRELALAGVAVLMISSDLEEIIGVSDRVLVMHLGRLAGELARGDLTEEAIMTLATGGG